MDSVPQGGVIYVIVNMINGTLYVGQTIRSATKRRSDHIYNLKKGDHPNCHMQAAWIKYGEHAFEFFVLETFKTVQATNNAECFYMEYFRSAGVPLYNLKEGGLNGRHSHETKAKMSAWQIGRKMSAESIAKHRAAITGRKHSEEQNAKRLGRKASSATRAKMSAARLGRKESEETKNRKRAALIGRPYNDKVKANMRAAHQTTDYKDKHRAACLNKSTKTLVFQSANGDVVRIRLMSDFIQEYQLRQSSVSSLVHGKRKTHRGWTFVGFEADYGVDSDP